MWCDPRAKALIEAEALMRPRVETGGALFGYGDRADVVIACAYGPGLRAKHRRSTFEPHPATTGALMDGVWEASEARYRYLGSWHSHPGGPARPSGQDIDTTERVAGEDHVLLPSPLVLIQSTRPDSGGARLGELRAWRWDPDVAWLLPCELEYVELDDCYCPEVEVPGGRLRAARVVSPDRPGVSS